MIDDKEGMDNALEYHTNGDNEAYWNWFMDKLNNRLEKQAEKKVEEGVNEVNGWKDDYDDPDTYDDSYAYEEGWDYDYDDEWEDFDWDEYIVGDDEE